MGRPSRIMHGKCVGGAMVRYAPPRGGSMFGTIGLPELIILAFFGMIVLAVGVVVVFGVMAATKTRPSRPGPAFAAGPPVLSNSEVLTNDSIVQLVAAGLGEDVVIEKIRQSRCAFSVS